MLLAAADAAPDAHRGRRAPEGRARDQARRALRQLGRRPRSCAGIAGQPLPDTQSGFRIYPVAATLALGAARQRATTSRPRSCCAPRAAASPCVGVPVARLLPADRRAREPLPARGPTRCASSRSVLRVLVDAGADGRPDGPLCRAGAASAKSAAMRFVSRSPSRARRRLRRLRRVQPDRRTSAGQGDRHREHREGSATPGT